ncbi:MAG: hypothetical protein K2K58_10520 [Muribaculaceae bacterium]|nr:hypothetical protein [Muribaculaceae bacterium]
MFRTAKSILADYTKAQEKNAPVSLYVRQAREWIDRVEQALPETDGKTITQILPLYDIIHGIAYGKPSDGTFADKWYSAALRNLPKGGNADKVVLMYWIQHKTLHNPRTVGLNLLTWYTHTLDTWMQEARTYHPLSNHTPREARRIADFLQTADLYAWTADPASFKTTLKEKIG